MYRSILFVPGNRSDRFQKALDAGADAICIDLEDAVPPELKAQTREIISSIPTGSSEGSAICLRINALTTRDGILDLAVLAQADSRPDVLALPKARSRAELSLIAAALGNDIPIVAIIETAEGLHAANEIASHPSVQALMFGSADYSQEIGSSMSWDALIYARGRIISAAAAHGKMALDGVWMDIDNDEGLIADTKRIRDIGFDGRAAIHPRQIPGIHTGFAPLPSEINLARKFINAFESAKGNPVKVDGRLISVPVYEAARRLLKGSERKT